LKIKEQKHRGLKLQENHIEETKKEIRKKEIKKKISQLNHEPIEE
jgi:hypothetical protein